MIDKLIANFNFEEKEAKVYVANLELGRSLVSDIAKKAGLNRITTYEILKRLRRKSIATSMDYKGVTVFQVVDPARLIDKMERQVSLSKNILPQLLALKKSDSRRPKVEYYDGVDGIKAIYDGTFSCKEKIIYNIAHPISLPGAVGEEFLNDYIKRRAAKKIKVKLLAPDIPETKKYTKKDKVSFRESRFYDEKLYPMSNELMIYDNKVVLLSFAGKMGVIIEDEEIAMSLKSMWQFFWDHSVSS
jgi:sugar-specific transcriptional regulator TrmB